MSGVRCQKISKEASIQNPVCGEAKLCLIILALSLSGNVRTEEIWHLHLHLL